jgi:hypothetical protein
LKSPTADKPWRREFVRKLEKDEQCEDWLVIVQLYNRNTDEGCAPDRWEAAWFHFTKVLRESFWDYTDKFCPDPELVHQAVANLKLQLPPELQVDLHAGMA